MFSRSRRRWNNFYIEKAPTCLLLLPRILLNRKPISTASMLFPLLPREKTSIELLLRDFPRQGPRSNRVQNPSSPSLSPSFFRLTSTSFPTSCPSYIAFLASSCLQDTWRPSQSVETSRMRPPFNSDLPAVPHHGSIHSVPCRYSLEIHRP